MAILAPGAINYVIAVDSSRPGSRDDLTPFQGFSGRVLGGASILASIACLPSHVLEPFIARDLAFSRRSAGSAPYQVLFLETDLLEKRLPEIDFVCIISDTHTFEAVDASIRATGSPCLHATIAPSPSTAVPLNELNREVIGKWLLGYPGFTGASDMVPTTWAMEPIPTLRRGHNVTVPNELMLRAAALSQTDGDPLPAFTSADSHKEHDNRFAEAISASARAVIEQRERFLDGTDCYPGTTSLILTAPAVFRWVRPPSSGADSAVPERKALRAVLQQLGKQEHYPQVIVNSTQELDLIMSPAGKAALRIRRLELDLYTGVLAVVGSGSFAPVVRVPPIGGALRDSMNKLAGAVRSTGPNRQAKLNRLGQELGNSLLSHVPEVLRSLLDQGQTGIKLIGDIPFELVPVKGLPLSLHRTVSRLPSLPGDLLVRKGLAGGQLILAAEELHKVTLLRSFRQRDPLRPLVERAIRAFLAGSERPIELTVIDVNTRQELVNALRANRSPILILDGHGFQSPHDDFGVLIVGNDRIHPQELVDCSFPAVVILSACDTHPLDGTHQSVANAVLAMGAITVLGTLTPISGKHSAVLIGRLLLRLAEFVPRLRSPMLWTEVIAGLMRMSYVTDVLAEFARTGRIRLDDAQIRESQTKANLAINTFARDWFSRTVSAVADATGLPEDEVERHWRQVAYFTETLQYVQLGNPERLLIAKLK